MYLEAQNREPGAQSRWKALVHVGKVQRPALYHSVGACGKLRRCGHRHYCEVTTTHSSLARAKQSDLRLRHQVLQSVLVLETVGGSQVTFSVT